jgi:hypothetical protein
VVEDYMWPRGSVWIDDDFYRRAFHDDEVQEFGITVDGSRPVADVQRDVEALVRPRFAAFVVDTPTAERDVMRIVQQYWTLLFAQEGLAITVAFLGTLHTLLISVLLRRREIALLRALGAPLSMLRSMLWTEGILLGLAGGAIGVCFGLGAAAIALRMLSLEEQGFAVAAPAVAAGRAGHDRGGRLHRLARRHPAGPQRGARRQSRKLGGRRGARGAARHHELRRAHAVERNDERDGERARAARDLEALLRLAYSGELAAAHAYRGHWRSLAAGDERERVRAIEAEEWHHRRQVGAMLAALGATPAAAARRARG